MNEQQQQPREDPRYDERDMGSREETSAERPMEPRNDERDMGAREDTTTERPMEPRYDDRQRGDREETAMGHATDRPGMTHESNLFPELSDYMQRFDSLQAEFIDEPRSAVHKAETLIEEAVDRMMSSLRERLRQIHDEAGSDGDTEKMRVAMRNYREVIHSLGGGTHS